MLIDSSLTVTGTVVDSIPGLHPNDYYADAADYDIMISKHFKSRRKFRMCVRSRLGRCLNNM